MNITSTMAFDASPPRVADMLINSDFAAHVAQEIKADKVTTTALADGLASVFTLRTPEEAKRFLGPVMTIKETLTWRESSGEVRHGQLDLAIAGVPASARGPLELRPTSPGSELVYDCDFRVKIPLIGKKVEKLAEQYLSDIISACEKVGNEWLADNE
jgi:hypothetical protein